MPHASHVAGIFHRRAPRFRFDTTGSGFDAILAVYTGSSLDKLSEVTSRADTGAVTFLAQRGIVVGSTRAASPGAFLRNNIVSNNGADSPDPLNILVRTDPSSETACDDAAKLENELAG